jgi:hypothetical protein
MALKGQHFPKIKWDITYRMAEEEKITFFIFGYLKNLLLFAVLSSAQGCYKEMSSILADQ